MRFHQFSATLLLAALAVSFAVPNLRAQQAASDVAVVSIAPIDRLLKDTSYLLRACNVPEMGGLVTIMVNQYTQGLDRTKPIGARVTLQDGVPNAVVFLPMKDRNLFFTALAGMGIEPDDLGDGLFEIAAPNGQMIYAKEADGWMYIAQTENAFGTLPADPSSMLGNLPSNYDVAVRLNAREIPQEYKEGALEQIRIGYERSMAVQQNQTEQEQEAARQAGEASIAQFEKLFQETDQLILGWSVSSQEQRTYIDTGIRFIEGTSLAEQAQALGDVTSKYTNFFVPNPTAKMRFTSVIPESDRELTKASFRSSLSQVERQLEQAADMPPEGKELLGELLSGLADIMEQTIEEGKFDGAGSLSVADDTLRFLVGGQIADGNALAAEFRRAAANIPADAENVPKFEFDYATHNGFNLHRVTAPIRSSDPVAQRVFGDQLVVTIGTADKSYLIALDPAGDSLARSAIDQLALAEEAEVSPFEVVVELEDILRFAQAVSPNSILDNAVNTISQYAGKDKVELNSRLIERGALYRFVVEEGVMRAAGAAAKAGSAGAAGQQGF